MKKIQKKWLSNIILGYLLLNPIFDVLTSFSIHFLSKSMPVVLIIKVLFILFLLFLNWQQKEKKSFYYSIGLFFYFLCFFFLIYQKHGISSFFLEAQSLFRTFYFPCIFLFLYPLQKKGILEIKISNLCYILFFYLFFLVVPEFFHLGFSSYTEGKIGGLGWYYSTNEISGILAILGPFLVPYLKNKNYFLKILFIVFYMSGIFIIGTKVPILAFMITIFFFFVSFLWELWKKKAWKKLLLSISSSMIAFGCFIVILLSSSFYQNIKIHLEFLQIHQVSDLMTFHNIDHFVFSERLSFFQNTLTLYKNSSTCEKILGMGNVEYGKTNPRKMIEMDYFDLFFSYGIIGTILFFAPFFLISIKRKFLLEEKISIFLIVLLAFFSGHILIAPSVSILVALIFLPKKEMI